MASLENLKMQLASAVQRLEAAVEPTGEQPSADKLAQHRDALISDVAKLKGENIRLKAKLTALEKEHVTLQKTTNRVSGKLDDVIGEIQTVLGS